MFTMKMRRKKVQPHLIFRYFLDLLPVRGDRLEDPDLPALLPVLLAHVVLEVVAVEEEDVLRL